MTQLTDKERDAQMADMKSFDEQMPCVGIFWYDPEGHTLFGVHKKELTYQLYLWCLVAVWHGLLTSSSYLWGSGLSLYKKS